MQSLRVLDRFGFTSLEEIETIVTLGSILGFLRAA